MVALLSSVVAVLLLCHAPKTVMNLFECYHVLRYGRMSAEPLWTKELTQTFLLPPNNSLLRHLLM